MIDPLELLEAAVRIPSVSGQEAEVAEYLVSRMAAFAADASIDAAGNAVGVVGDGPLEVMFLGHLDTYPGRLQVRWEGDRLYGRGAVDAKGPLCSAIAAASALPQEVLESITLTLVGAVGEEAPGSVGARHLLETRGAPDLLIVGEPSGWEGITLGYKGRLALRLLCVKPSRHSAADEATSAEALVDVWQSVRDWAGRFNEGRERVFDRVQASLQSIESWDDGQEQGCRANVGFRLPPDLPPDAAREELARLVPDALFDCFGNSELPYRGEKDNLLTRSLRSAIRESGGRPRFKLKTGTSDMNVVAPVWGCPAVAYGPGDSSLDHTPQEHVEAGEVRLATQVLRRTLEVLRAQRARSSS